MTMPADLPTIFKAIDSQSFGTRFFRGELHFHTPASSDAHGANKYGYNPYKIPYPPRAAAAGPASAETQRKLNELLREIQASQDIKNLPELQILEQDYPATERDFQYRLLFYARVKAALIVDRFCEKELSLVAITDHNGIGTIWPDARGYMDLAAPTWYELVAEEAENGNPTRGTRYDVSSPGPRRHG